MKEKKLHFFSSFTWKHLLHLLFLTFILSTFDFVSLIVCFYLFSLHLFRNWRRTDSRGFEWRDSRTFCVSFLVHIFNLTQRKLSHTPLLFVSVACWLEIKPTSYGTYLILHAGGIDYQRVARHLVGKKKRKKKVTYNPCLKCIQIFFTAVWDKRGEEKKKKRNRREEKKIVRRFSLPWHLRVVQWEVAVGGGVRLSPDPGPRLLSFFFFFCLAGPPLVG